MSTSPSHSIGNDSQSQVLTAPHPPLVTLTDQEAAYTRAVAKQRHQTARQAEATLVTATETIAGQEYGVEAFITPPTETLDRHQLDSLNAAFTPHREAAATGNGGN